MQLKYRLVFRSIVCARVHCTGNSERLATTTHGWKFSQTGGHFQSEPIFTMSSEGEQPVKLISGDNVEIVTGMRSFHT